MPEQTNDQSESSAGAAEAAAGPDPMLRESIASGAVIAPAGDGVLEVSPDLLPDAVSLPDRLIADRRAVIEEEAARIVTVLLAHAAVAASIAQSTGPEALSSIAGRLMEAVVELSLLGDDRDPGPVLREVAAAALAEHNRGRS
jgi:hypothetical protein